MGRVLDMAHSGSVVYLDDIQKRKVREAAHDEVNRRGYQFFDLTGFTFDAFGRYAAMALGS
jgi:hypothetical protein